MKSSRPIGKVFKDASDELATLITRTKQLKRFTSQLRRHLDAELAPHCYIGNLEKSSLTIMVDSAAWATKLRFVAPTLIAPLRQESPVFSEIKQIMVKVLTPTPESEVSIHTQGPQMNEENARGIESLADDIDDPALQQALHKLARHAQDKK